MGTSFNHILHFSCHAQFSMPCTIKPKYTSQGKNLSHSMPKSVLPLPTTQIFHHRLQLTPNPNTLPNAKISHPMPKSLLPLPNTQVFHRRRQPTPNPNPDLTLAFPFRHPSPNPNRRPNAKNLPPMQQFPNPLPKQKSSVVDYNPNPNPNTPKECCKSVNWNKLERETEDRQCVLLTKTGFQMIQTVNPQTKTFILINVQNEDFSHHNHLFFRHDFVRMLKIRCVILSFEINPSSNYKSACGTTVGQCTNFHLDVHLVWNLICLRSTSETQGLDQISGRHVIFLLSWWSFWYWGCEWFEYSSTFLKCSFKIVPAVHCYSIPQVT